MTCVIYLALMVIGCMCVGAYINYKAQRDIAKAKTASKTIIQLSTDNRHYQIGWQDGYKVGITKRRQDAEEGRTNEPK